jgi:restriction system protein
MGRKRGFFAEVAHQHQLAKKQQEREAAAAHRAMLKALRDQERARQHADRAQRAAEAADAREKARLEKEAAAAHAAEQMAKVDAMNASLEAAYGEIDGILASTLAVDDHVDLESLKVVVEHPRFDPGAAGVPTPSVPDLVYPPEPEYVEPPAPKGLFGKRKKHETAIEQAKEQHQADVAAWRAAIERADAEHAAAATAREAAEQQRLVDLAELEAVYRTECEQREKDAAQRNEELAKLINDFAFDVESAIDEYIGIVLSNSVYPDMFPVEHDYRFDLASRELTITALVPPPEKMPTIKAYRYVKSTDEIVSSDLSAKARKDRYSSAVAQVAVRTLHEVFEADRTGKVHTISLTVGSEAIDPATGRQELVPFVVVAAARQQFVKFDLANVVPSATLDHLGAAVSKSPLDLVPADTSRGVRVRGQ